jgi:hypothetical protein
MLMQPCIRPPAGLLAAVAFVSLLHAAVDALAKLLASASALLACCCRAPTGSLAHSSHPLPSLLLLLLLYASTVVFEDGEKVNTQLYQEQYEFLPVDGASECCRLRVSAPQSLCMAQGGRILNGFKNKPESIPYILQERVSVHNGVC